MPGEVRFIPREREILRLVGAGLTNAEIGAAMFLAPGTIKHHMLEIYEKLGAPNRAAAVHAARRLGRARRPRALTPAPSRTRRCACWWPIRATCAAPASLLALQRPAVGRGVRGAQLRTRRRDAAAPDSLVERTRVRRDVTRSCADDEAVSGAEARAAADPVSPRERDVLAAFATGATNPAIAQELGLSPNTVKQHASSIFRKLGVRNRAEAVRRADELGLLAA